MTRRAGVLALVVALLAAFASPAGGQEPSATIQLDRSSIRPGAKVIVSLEHWPVGAVAVGVCGNAAARGDVDCDLIASTAVKIEPTGLTRVELEVTRPPMPCPCVVRAHNAGDTIVRTAAIDIIGAASAPVVAPDPASVPVVRVTAEVLGSHQSLFGTLRTSLGGRAPRVLRVHLTNGGTTRLAGVTATAAVGRDVQQGEPIPVPEILPIEPGESRTIDLPFTLSAPAFGSYRAFGTVYGPGAPVSFVATTSTTPVALVIVVLALVGDAIGYVWLRQRRQRRQRQQPLTEPSWPRGEPQVSAEPTLAEQAPETPSGPGSDEGGLPSSDREDDDATAR